jgi:hypothetical protein
MAEYSDFLKSKELVSTYLCTRYLFEHSTYMNEMFQGLVRDFQNDFPYLLSFLPNQEDVVDVILGHFPILAHYLFYHECFNKQLGFMKKPIMNGYEVSIRILIAKHFVLETDSINVSQIWFVV